MSMVMHYYRKTEPAHSLLMSVQEELRNLGIGEECAKIQNIETEKCFNVQIDGTLSKEQTGQLEWLLSETFEPTLLTLEKSSFTTNTGGGALLLEFGPRLTFTSAFSSNAVSICQSCHLPISRLELSRRYRFALTQNVSDTALQAIKLMLHDRMTEEEYIDSLKSFDAGNTAEPTKIVQILENGRAALEEINQSMGLGFDDHDLDYYTKIFTVSLAFEKITFS
jgi:phosphoribosylformylglycinamidine synthase